MFDLSCFCQEAIILPHRPLTLSCAMNGRLAPLLYSSTPNSLSEFLGHSSSSHRLIRIVVSGPRSHALNQLLLRGILTALQNNSMVGNADMA